jgi:hypothetical protein
MVQVNPVFFDHAIEVDEDEAESLRLQGLLREDKPDPKRDAAKAPVEKQEQ